MEQQRKVTKHDIEMIKYFWQEKGDVERYSSFENIQEDLYINYFELIHAISIYKSSIKILSEIVDDLSFKK